MSGVQNRWDGRPTHSHSGLVPDWLMPSDSKIQDCKDRCKTFTETPLSEDVAQATVCAIMPGKPRSLADEENLTVDSTHVRLFELDLPAEAACAKFQDYFFIFVFKPCVAAFSHDSRQGLSAKLLDFANRLLREVGTREDIVTSVDEVKEFAGGQVAVVVDTTRSKFTYQGTPNVTP